MEKIKLDDYLLNFRESFDLIEHITRDQQQCVIDSFRIIREKEDEIKIINHDLFEAKKELEAIKIENDSLKGNNKKLLENFDGEIKKKQELQRENNESKSEISSLKESVKIVNQKNQALIQQRKDNFDKVRPNQISSCEELEQILENIKGLVISLEFKNSPFNIIYFEESSFDDVQSWLNEEKQRLVKIEDFDKRDFSELLFDLLVKNIDVFSKIFRLNMYGKIDIIEKDLRKYLDVKQLSKYIERIKSILTDNRIGIKYPCPFIESFSEDEFQLELHNDINQINPNYTIGFNSNKITELSKIGIEFASNYIKPIVTRKS
jgi:hypothetical protein